MKKIIATLILLVFMFYIYNTIKVFKFGNDFINAKNNNNKISKKLEAPAKHYLENNKLENNSANVVTSIVVSYRGFDTLGEVTVLFLASTGLGVILTLTRKEREEKKKKESEEGDLSIIVKTASRILFPMIFLFGVYVFIHGHLTPGGGFQGGAIIATAYLMMFISYKEFKINHSIFKSIESLSGLAFVSIGLIGLIGFGVFLKLDLIPMGVFNTLFSAGLIPIVYIVVGFKVGSELTAVIDSYRENW
jgi:multicomponent Na+:H+ antiporter subunit B